MSQAEKEIFTQPECWEAAVELAARARPLLPCPGETVAVVGCGTSYNMALAYAWMREGLGQGTTDAMTASQLRPRRAYDRYLFISRSGTTTEVVDAVAVLPAGPPKVAVTAAPSSPLGQLVTAIDLTFAGEASVVQTRFATTALVLLRSHLGEAPQDLPSGARQALGSPLPVGCREAGHFVFLGQDWATGIAHEAALKLREGAQMWTESYPALELRHGPVSVLTEASLVWCFGPPPAGLAAEVEATGARFATSSLDPLADLVRVHRLAVQLAEAKGLDPDHPRNLSYSVVLPPGR